MAQGHFDSTARNQRPVITVVTVLSPQKKVKFSCMHFLLSLISLNVK